MCRRVLDAVLPEYGLPGFSDAEREELTRAWQRLTPWPDVAPGLTRIKRAFTIATLSNADVHAAVNLSKRAGLPWDAIFAAEMAGVFKPDPAIYRTSPATSPLVAVRAAKKFFATGEICFTVGSVPPHCKKKTRRRVDLVGTRPRRRRRPRR